MYLANEIKNQHKKIKYLTFLIQYSIYLLNNCFIIYNITIKYIINYKHKCNNTKY